MIATLCALYGLGCYRYWFGCWPFWTLNQIEGGCRAAWRRDYKPSPGVTHRQPKPKPPRLGFSTFTPRKPWKYYCWEHQETTVGGGETEPYCVPCRLGKPAVRDPLEADFQMGYLPHSVAQMEQAEVRARFKESRRAVERAQHEIQVAKRAMDRGDLTVEGYRAIKKMVMSDSSARRRG